MNAHHCWYPHFAQFDTDLAKASGLSRMRAVWIPGKNLTLCEYEHRSYSLPVWLPIESSNPKATGVPFPSYGISWKWWWAITQVIIRWDTRFLWVSEYSNQFSSHAFGLVSRCGIYHNGLFIWQKLVEGHGLRGFLNFYKPLPHFYFCLPIKWLSVPHKISTVVKPMPFNPSIWGCYGRSWVKCRALAAINPYC